MAQAALFDIAGKLLVTIASPAFKEAYKKAQSIWGAREDLDQLEKTIKSLQSFLLDAEKKQHGSETIKNWIMRVGDVLYEADDLFDEISTKDLLMQQITGNKLKKKAQVFFSSSNTIIFNNSIAKQVKAIRERLDRIEKDMKLSMFNFVPCAHEAEARAAGEGVDTGHLVDPKKVFGRDHDKKTILGFLSSKSNMQKDVSMIAIVGIGGMGKTTLAKLVLSDIETQQNFSEPWWACISKVFDEKEILKIIFKSMGGQNSENLNMSQLQFQIRQSIKGHGKYLLVLDNMWDVDSNRWSNLRHLLGCGGAKGSKIIVTTRHLSVAWAMRANEVHNLGGLCKRDKWKLFKSCAFTPEQEKDPQWIALGEEILKLCTDVPMDINNIAGLLHTKSTFEEWVFLKDNELSTIKSSDNPTMATLKLSYDHLNTNLKNCFAYCSVFPKGHKISKQKLIYLWTSQGYVSGWENGLTYFIELLKMFFLQEASEGWYVLHDLVHDLAQTVAGDGVAIWSKKSRQATNNIRHVYINNDCLLGADDMWEFPPALHNAKRLRSFLFKDAGELPPLVISQQLVKFKYLRALHLSDLGIEKVPSSIGKLIHLRYLDLSSNNFKTLPDSLTKLLNMLTLDISGCRHLEALPNHFRKLINLRHLIMLYEYPDLQSMPSGFEELSSLQRLNYFIVDKATGGGKGNSLDALAQMNLRGELKIEFSKKQDAWDEAALISGVSKIPCRLEVLRLHSYPGTRIQSLPSKLVVLQLYKCEKAKHLPSFRSFPYLKELELCFMDELEYLEEDENIIGSVEPTQSSASCLKTLQLRILPKLRGWSRKGISASGIFTIPPHLRFLEGLEFSSCDEIETFSGDELTSLKDLYIGYCDKLENVYLPSMGSNVLEYLYVQECPELESFPSEASNCLRELRIGNCYKLKNACLPTGHLNNLEVLRVEGCPDFELKGEDNRVMEWVSLHKLRELKLNSLAKLEGFPGENLTSLQDLEISNCSGLKNLHLPAVGSNILKKLKIHDCQALRSAFDWVSLRNLRELTLDQLPMLESFQGEAFTYLRVLEICDCSKLKEVSLPSNILEILTIRGCPEFELWGEDQKVVNWDSFSNIYELCFYDFPQLEDFQGEGLTSLYSVEIGRCNKLKSVKLPPQLGKLKFTQCPELELWKGKKGGFDLDSLPTLHTLQVDQVPKKVRFPRCVEGVYINDDQCD